MSNSKPKLNEEFYKWMFSRYEKFGSIEFRALPTGNRTGVFSGLYKKYTDFAKDFPKWKTSERNVYLTLNPVSSEIKPYEFAQKSKTTSDTDIENIHLIMIDFDRKNNKKIPASDLELSICKQQADLFLKHLQEKEIPYWFLLSGNGYHFLIPTIPYPLADTPRTSTLLKKLNVLYENDHVEIDVCVSNAARIFRAPGFVNRKGEQSLDRPFRRAKVLAKSEHLDPVDLFEKFEITGKILNLKKYDTQTYISELSQTAYTSERINLHTFSVVEYFKKLELYVRPIKNGKTHIVLCPFREGHSNESDRTTSTIIYEGDFSKPAAFDCKHNHCSHIKLRNILEHFGTEETQKPVSMQNEKKYELNIRTVKELIASKEDEQTEWVVENVLPRGGLSILVAKPKVGKTTLLKDLALAVAHGNIWAGRQCHPSRVLYLALEEKASQLRKSFEEMGAQNEMDVLVHTNGIPPRMIDQISDIIRKERLGLLLIDTLFKFQPVSDSNSYSETQNALTPLLNIARDTNCHILATHHAGKTDRPNDDSYIGSSAIFGSVDTQLMLIKNGDERWLSSTQRYGEDLEAICVVRGINGFLDYKIKSEVVLSNLRARILNQFTSAEPQLTEAAIYANSNSSKSSFNKTFRALIKDQTLLRLGNGVKNDPYQYKLNPSSAFSSIKEEPE